MADQVPPDELTTTENAAVEIPQKLRVHALAKLLGVTSKQVLAELAALGEQVKTAHSSVERAAALRVQSALAGDVAPPAAEQTPAAEPAPKTAKAPKAAKAVKTEAPAATPAFEQPLFLPPEPAKGVAAPKKRAPAKKTAPLAFTEPTAEKTPAVTAPVEKLVEPSGETTEEPTGEPAELTSTATPEAPAVEIDVPAAAGPDADDADSSDADGSDSDDSDSDDSESSRSRRRRRGRRGRGRGRGEQHSEDGSDSDHYSDEDADHSDVVAQTELDAPESTSDEAGVEQGQDGEANTDDAEEAAPRTGRRRSRRSSRSSGASSSSSDSTETVDSAPADTSGADHTEPAESVEETGSDEQSSDEDSDSSGDDDGNGSRRRRRRRRRRSGGGDDDETSQDDPPNTVVHEREPRNKRTPRDEVQGISGSTRLEAKRQRRRDGREAGRRRPPILSESEFLARREAVDRVMVVREKANSHGGGVVTQVGVLEDKVLVEHFVTSAATPSIVGNVYVGRVQNVLPSMEAAFIDIGRGRNGVLYAGEVDWAAAGLGGSSRKIEQALRPGDQVLVQVSKDPVGHKGARLTTQISMAGRFLVYVPGGSSTGISRKLPDTERARLKAILKQIVPANAGVIIRTASEGVSEDELARDVDRLQKLWESIQKLADEEKANKSNSPKALYEEPDLLVKVVRDLFNEDFAKLVIDGDQAWDTVSSYIGRVAPDLMERVERHDRRGGSTDAFGAYRIDEQLVKALDRKVWLPSGGTLVIDRTEAMTVVDVNTGKYTGSGGNLEETVTRNNLEAAEEVVRQMRLRDIGGMIVVDFIDMVLESNRDLVLRRLTEALGRDRTRHQVSEVTSLGLVQMTRKRMGTGLIEAFSTNCEHCHGRGLMIHADPIVSESEADSGRSSRGESGTRRARRGKGNDTPAVETAEEKAAGHSPAEHPMFKAMAEHEHPDGEDGAESAADSAEHEIEPGSASGQQAAPESTGQDRPSRRERGRRGQRSAGSAGSQAEAAHEADADEAPAQVQPSTAQPSTTQPSTAQRSAAEQSAADAKSEAKLDAMAKIEAAVARSAGPRKRTQQAPSGNRRGSQPERPAAKAVVPATVPEPVVKAEEPKQAPAAPAAESGPPARRRSRRAARPASAPVEHAQPTAEPVRSEVIVPAAQPVAAPVAAPAVTAPAAPSGDAAATAAAAVRRPRRRAAGRQAGPPVAP
ncbi:translation initiation factor IF-2 N-terminal domain-containing protein [Tomitella biformata]|uniref:translation initiation factor IF-2 N-terminal domain-containing protein n=1 Tax=Tomitella biformata TaxID=630403 RepID=UPI000464B5E9|nr:translation initiation factor IF-2 N-terminal domain-containing protein [Tomitella biformata]